jgi:hypothetical protein
MNLLSKISLKTSSVSNENSNRHATVCILPVSDQLIGNGRLFPKLRESEETEGFSSAAAKIIIIDILVYHVINQISL